MSTCTLADPGVAAGWPALMGADPFGREGADADPLLADVFDLVPIYNNVHSLTIDLGDTLPSGAGLSWDSVDPSILVHSGTLLRGSLDCGTGVKFRGTNGGVINTDPLDDPTLYTDPESPHSGNLSFGDTTYVRLNNYVLWQPSGGAMKNLQWRVTIDPAGTGNFTLTLTSSGNVGKPDGTGTTAPIPVGATLDQVQAAVEALPFVGDATVGHAGRSNVSVNGNVGDYVLIFNDGGYHDQIYITAMSSSGPVQSIVSRPGIYGGEGSAMPMQNVQDLLATKLWVHNFLADGPKTGGTCYDIGLVNSTIRQHPARNRFGGHDDGFIPRALDNTGAVTGRTPRYALDLCYIQMVSGNACCYMAGFETVQGCQGVIAKRTLFDGQNKAIAQNGLNNHRSGASDCWINSTQISDNSARDEGTGHSRSPEYVWQNVRRSDPQGADPRGTPIPPHSPDPGVTWMPEPAGYVSFCSGAGSGDVTPPTVPTGLAATPGAGYVDLSWNPSSD